MSRRLFSIWLLGCFTFLLFSCSGIEEIKVGNIRNIELKGINNNVIDVELTLPVENPNSFNVKLKDANLEVTNVETLIGTITQMDEIVISAKTTKDYTIHVKVTLVGRNINLISIYSLFNNKPDLGLSGTIKIRSSLYRGKIKIKDYQLVN
jgi:hypothetical protein